MLQKWIETRQLISRARTDWATDRETLHQTRRLFERELDLAESELGKLTTNSAQVELERAQAEALLKSSNESLDRAREFAAAFEVRLAKLVPRLPGPLQDILQPLLRRLPTDPLQTRMSAAERVQVLVSVLNEVDKFNNAVSVFSEKRTNEKGEEVAVETVYVGLGAAYFVNGLGDLAGLGAPAASGWEWTTKSELAPLVREVIRIYRNERAARFVSLPVIIR